jgi:HPt (histidine-containing phosphotransfer) domain-containing protein
MNQGDTTASTIVAQSLRDSPEFAALKSTEFAPGLLWDRVDGDAELLHRLVVIFTSQYPELLLQMEKAIAQQESGMLWHASHKMKGSALQLSAAGAVALAGNLEAMGAAGSLAGAAEILANLEAELHSLLEKLNLMIAAARNSAR